MLPNGSLRPSQPILKELDDRNEYSALIVEDERDELAAARRRLRAEGRKRRRVKQAGRKAGHYYPPDAAGFRDLSGRAAPASETWRRKSRWHFTARGTEEDRAAALSGG